MIVKKQTMKLGRILKDENRNTKWEITTQKAL